MKVPVSLTLDYDYLMYLKKECRTLDVKFNDYVAAAIAAFMSPRDYAIKKEKEEDDRLEGKITASSPRKANETVS